MNIVPKIQARGRHLAAIVRPSGYRHSELLIAPESFFHKTPSPELECALAEVLRTEGSDKSSSHDYHRVYSFVLANKQDGPVLEIGLGSNNVEVPSNMGAKGVPGASLRAWRRMGVFSEVWGADVDRGVLFSEPGIVTRFVDQLDEMSIANLEQELRTVFPGGLSLVIDDGLHTAQANINTIRGLWGCVKPGGYLCVEDMEPADLHDVLSFAVREVIDAEWALWSNANRASDNHVLLLRRRNLKIE